MRRVALLTTFLFAGCATGPLETPAGTDFSLSLGRTAVVRVPGSSNTLTLKFAAVPQDSRCAVDVVCVQQGNAEVQLEAVDEQGNVLVPRAVGRNPSVLDSRLGPTERIVLNTSQEPRSVLFGNWTVTLVALDPPPLSTQPPASRPYRATLSVESAVLQ